MNRGINFDFEDSRLREILTLFLSGLVYKENFKKEYFSKILKIIFKYIKLEEMKVEFFVLFYILDNMSRISLATVEYTPMLRAENLEYLLKNNIPRMITDKNFGITEWLDSNGINSNLNIEEDFEIACGKLYQACIDLFNSAIEVNKDSEEVLSLEPALKEVVFQNAEECATKSLSRILFTGVRIGRKTYKGNEDWLEYCSIVATALRTRLQESVDDNDDGLYQNAEQVHGVIRRARELSVAVCNYGIPEIDDFTPILRHRLTTIVGTANVGKTKTIVWLAAKLLLNGNKVAFVSGETPKEALTCQIISSYIFQKWRRFATVDHILGRLPVDEATKKLINIAASEIGKSGLLNVKSTLSYDNVYTELKSIYDEQEFDVLFVDHTASLSGGAGMDLRLKVDNLAKDARRFKVDYPVSIVLLSHPSTKAEECILAGKRVEGTSTAYSAMPDKESDEIFVISTSERLSKAGLISLQVKKRRGPAVLHNIYLRTLYNVESLEYRLEDQKANNMVRVEQEQALADIENAYDSDDDDGLDVDFD